MDSPERVTLIEGRIEGINRAIKILYAIFSFDLKNSENESLSEEEQDKALNCALRLGQMCSILQEQRDNVDNWIVSKEEQSKNYIGRDDGVSD